MEKLILWAVLCRLNNNSMSNDTTGDLDTLIQNKLDSDADFQASLDSLSDDEKEQTISQKKSELTKQVFKEVADEAAKNKELAGNYKIRAEKAEKNPKKAGEESPKTPNEPNFDLEDVAVLVQSVPVKEDREMVKKYAKFQGISLEEALKDPVVKTLLKENGEQRKTADVTNTSGSKRTTQKVTDEQIIQRAEEGKEFDPEALAEARMNLKKGQSKR